MGRKIPAKKHRGVKDPYKQQEQRLNKIKDKLNCKPSSIDAQEIPRKLENIAKFMNSDNKGEIMVKRKRKRRHSELLDGTKFVDQEMDEPGMTRPLKMIPALKQHQNESVKKFMKRVDRATKVILKEAAFEDKYKVDVMRDEQGNVTQVKQREKNEHLLSEKQQLQNEEREKRKKQAQKDRDARRRQKNKKNVDDDDEFSYYQDKFEFGEVVYEPPSLDTAKLTKKLGGIVKPKTFLFMDKLKEAGNSEDPASSRLAKKPMKETPSAARKRILEDERLRVVEAYRQMKATKHHNVPGMSV
ncbi:coiled-coil domain-containing protein 137 [Procambarus clarkii]|uniref:coiled-coil domain-containing protein 137 n=1 Tax=Procambarus clarkii TaxID=6728 RepID=UPI001E673B65|nr:coiled-coil domain-containing protein 137-like [Procambarus clarkii]XP_045609284.1 coiled-coil domain-containing protein 137-like [Procambarus clarkii]XP_045609285.1 coiled-coil domain-containing protein 137-like [Procambarus clarkii]XP_045609286.1 coiled-coil domain-containing protein 137-like [Procambarus clarkii]